MFACLNHKISLNIFRPAVIYYRVRRFRNTFFALAAFLWLPASAHCQLETLPGFEFLHCAVDAKSSGDASNGCNDCGCCAVEKSQYRASHTCLNAPAPELLSIFSAPRLVSFQPLPAEVCVGVLTAAPPELLPSRHFLFRTALPVRAPSLAS
jgi:hypothetical protein